MIVYSVLYYVVYNCEVTREINPSLNEALTLL